MTLIKSKNELEIIYNKLVKEKYSSNDIVIYFFLKYYINITTYNFYKKQDKNKILCDKLFNERYSSKYIVGYFFVKHYINITTFNFFTKKYK